MDRVTEYVLGLTKKYNKKIFHLIQIIRLLLLQVLELSQTKVDVIFNSSEKN